MTHLSIQAMFYQLLQLDLLTNGIFDKICVDYQVEFSSIYFVVTTSKYIYAAFIELEEAFDTIDREAMWNVLKM